ncbi:MAG: glycosyltransferase family 2 protein [Simkaniaceae bacterium]|nr:glycosyltransferase family 2 protein [Simkaniaceae bacterium]
MKKYLLLPLVVFCFLLSAVECREPICLNMIVKDEAHVIERALNSVLEKIDYWVIVDTGSTDGTQEIILEALRDIPGELIERPWVNFGYNRQEALEYAKDRADYLLFLDADDYFKFPENYEFPELTFDAYDIQKGTQHYSYVNCLLIKADLPWEWVGALHEYLVCDEFHSQHQLDNVVCVYGGDGARSKDPEKYIKHVKILEEELERDPGNHRNTFYLAESYRDAGMLKEAIECFEARVALGGWDQEVFWSLFQIAYLKEQINYPIEDVIYSYKRAHAYRPHRSEPIYYLSRLYCNQERHDLAYHTIHEWKLFPKPQSKDTLFTLDWIEEYGMDFQLSLISYSFGKEEEFTRLCDHLLQIKNLPENYKEQVKINRTFSSILERKTVFIPILARNKAHLLPTYLQCIENLDYDKKLITLYINTNNNSDDTQKFLEEWLEKKGALYGAVIFESHEIPDLKETKPHEWNTERWNVLGTIRNRSLQIAKNRGCDYYFIVDCDNFLVPETLKELITKDKPIIAPLLRPCYYFGNNNSNFWADLDENGYYKDHVDYYKILYQQKLGTFQVPLVHHSYLVNVNEIDKLSYIDDSEEWEYLIFSRSARNNHVDQFICNEKEYGYFLHSPDSPTLEQEKKRWQEIEDIIVETLDSRNILFEAPNIFTEDPIEEEMEEDFYPLSTNRENKSVEMFYTMSQSYREMGRYEAALMVAEEGLKLALHIPGWIGDYGMLWEYSLAAYANGKFQKAVDATLKLLEYSEFDANTKDILTRNLGYFKSGIDVEQHMQNHWGYLPWERPKDLSKNIHDIYHSIEPSLHICIAASENLSSEQSILQSSIYFGHEVDVIGSTQGQRFRDYKKYLDNIPDTDVVLCITGKDALLLGNEQEILEKFLAFERPCLVAAEMQCHPFSHLSWHYPEVETKMRYVNSGVFIGYAGYIKELLKAFESLPDEIDSQGIFTFLYLYDPENIHLDHFSDIFLSLKNVEAEDFAWDYERKNIMYFPTHTKPLILYGSDQSLYQELDNHLFNKKNPLKGRIFPEDKRYSTFKKALELIEERGLQTIVETGTARHGIRDYIGNGGSTVIFADWAYHHEGSKFYSVDINPACILEASKAVGNNPSATLVCSDSLDFLQHFRSQIDFIYLDSLDFEYWHPEISQKHHLEEIKCAYDKLGPNSVVMIDDCDLPFGGKGKLVIEYLLDKGWKILEEGYQVILSQKD